MSGHASPSRRGLSIAAAALSLSLGAPLVSVVPPAVVPVAAAQTPASNQDGSTAAGEKIIHSDAILKSHQKADQTGNDWVRLTSAGMLIGESKTVSGRVMVSDALHNTDMFGWDVNGNTMSDPNTVDSAVPRSTFVYMQWRDKDGSVSPLYRAEVHYLAGHRNAIGEGRFAFDLSEGFKDAAGTVHEFKAAPDQSFRLWVDSYADSEVGGSQLLPLRQVHGRVPGAFVPFEQRNPHMSAIVEGQHTIVNTGIWLADARPPHLRAAQPTVDEKGPKDDLDVAEPDGRPVVSGQAWVEVWEPTTSSIPALTDEDRKASGYTVHISALTPEGAEAYKNQVLSKRVSERRKATNELLKEHPEYLAATVSGKVAEDGRYSVRLPKDGISTEFIYGWIEDPQGKPVAAYSPWTQGYFADPKERNERKAKSPNPGTLTVNGLRSWWGVNFGVIEAPKTDLNFDGFDRHAEKAKPGAPLNLKYMGELPAGQHTLVWKVANAKKHECVVTSAVEIEACALDVARDTPENSVITAELLVNGRVLAATSAVSGRAPEYSLEFADEAAANGVFAGDSVTAVVGGDALPAGTTLVWKRDGTQVSASPAAGELQYKVPADTPEGAVVTAQLVDAQGGVLGEAATTVTSQAIGLAFVNPDAAIYGGDTVKLTADKDLPGGAQKIVWHVGVAQHGESDVTDRASLEQLEFAVPNRPGAEIRAQFIRNGNVVETVTRKIGSPKIDLAFADSAAIYGGESLKLKANKPLPTGEKEIVWSVDGKDPKATTVRTNQGIEDIRIAVPERPGAEITVEYKHNGQTVQTLTKTVADRAIGLQFTDDEPLFGEETIRVTASKPLPEGEKKLVVLNDGNRTEYPVTDLSDIESIEIAVPKKPDAKITVQFVHKGKNVASDEISRTVGKREIGLSFIDDNLLYGGETLHLQAAADLPQGTKKILWTVDGKSDSKIVASHADISRISIAVPEKPGAVVKVNYLLDGKVIESLTRPVNARTIGLKFAGLVEPVYPGDTLYLTSDDTLPVGAKSIRWTVTGDRTEQDDVVDTLHDVKASAFTVPHAPGETVRAEFRHEGKGVETRELRIADPSIGLQIRTENDTVLVGDEISVVAAGQLPRGEKKELVWVVDGTPAKTCEVKSADQLTACTFTVTEGSTLNAVFRYRGVDYDTAEATITEPSADADKTAAPDVANEKLPKYDSDYEDAYEQAYVRAGEEVTSFAPVARVTIPGVEKPFEGQPFPEGTKFRLTKGDARVNENTGEITFRAARTAKAGEETAIGVTATLPDGQEVEATCIFQVVAREQAEIFEPKYEDGRVAVVGRSIRLKQIGDLDLLDVAEFSIDESANKDLGGWAAAVNAFTGDLDLTAPGEDAKPLSMKVTVIYQDGSSEQVDVTVGVIDPSKSQALRHEPRLEEQILAVGEEGAFELSGFPEGTTFELIDDGDLDKVRVDRRTGRTTFEVPEETIVDVEYTVTVRAIYPDGSSEPIELPVRVDSLARHSTPEWEKLTVPVGNNGAAAQIADLGDETEFAIHARFGVTGWEASVDKRNGELRVRTAPDVKPGTKITVPIVVTYSDRSQRVVEVEVAAGKPVDPKIVRPPENDTPRRGDLDWKGILIRTIIGLVAGVAAAVAFQDFFQDIIKQFDARRR